MPPTRQTTGGASAPIDGTLCHAYRMECLTIRERGVQTRQRWMIVLFATIITLGLAGLAAFGAVRERLTVVETNYGHMADRLDRIDGKLTTIIGLQRDAGASRSEEK